LSSNAESVEVHILIKRVCLFGQFQQTLQQFDFFFFYFKFQIQQCLMLYIKNYRYY